MRTRCIQDLENISSCKFYVYPENKLGKVLKYEAKKIMSIIYLETLNLKLTPKVLGGLRLCDSNDVLYGELVVLLVGCHTFGQPLDVTVCARSACSSSWR